MAYMNVDEIASAMTALARQYPASCTQIVLPHRSHEGRSISALRLGTLPIDQGDVMLITGSAHAREWGGADTCISLAADLLEAHANKTGLVYGNKTFTRGEVASIITGLHLVILPDVNPDGRAWSQGHDRMWRRNRNPHYANGNPDCIGVDLNRNYDFLWDYKKHYSASADVGTSDQPCDPQQTWRGPAPLSEPEVQNVDYLLHLFPRLRWYVDIHSYGELILYPWGDDESQTSNPAMNFQNAAYDGKRGVPSDNYREYIPASDLSLHKDMAAKMAAAIKSVRGTRYAPQPGFDLYPTSGCADDYAYSLHRIKASVPKIHAFTIEFGTQFQPPWSEMSKIIGDLSAGLITLALYGPQRAGSMTLRLDTPELKIGKSKRGEILLSVDSLQNLEVIVEASSGFTAVSLDVRGAVGQRQLRIPVRARRRRQGSIVLRCPQTQQRWEVPVTVGEY